jgi:hypothetical protein
MPVVSETSLKASLQNIVHFGDTDVLPFPLERHWFSSAEQDVVGVLQAIDKDFDAHLAS